MKDRIINYVFKNEDIISYMRRLVKSQDVDDLMSDLIIQLYKIDENKLIFLFNTNYFNYFCMTILKRIVYGGIKDSELFYKKSKRHSYEFLDDIFTQDLNYNYNLDRVYEILETSHWYDKALFKLYFIEGYNYREIFEKTGVNLHSVRYSVEKTLKNIKKQLNNE